MKDSDNPEAIKLNEDAPNFGERFTNLSAITRGKRSSTFRAQRSETGAWVFIKALNQGHVSDANAVAAFLNEAVLLKGLANSSASASVVPVLELSQSDTAPYFVEPLLSGWDLAQAMQHRVRFHALSVARIIEKCLDAFVQIHGAGVVHGDLSPENIFLVTDAPLRHDGVMPAVFSIRLVDFESARRIEGSENRHGRPILGKAPYMAPELVDGSPLSTQSDIYSAGVFFYEMLVGNRPYVVRTVDEIRKLNANSYAPIPVALGIPQLLEEFLQSLIAVEPERRFQTAAKALLEIRKLLELFNCLSRPIVAIPEGERSPSELREIGEYAEGGQRSTFASEYLRAPIVTAALNESSGRRKEISSDTICLPLGESVQEQRAVGFSVYAPERLRPGSAFLLDVWAYLPAQRADMLERASRRNRQVEVGSRGDVVIPAHANMWLRLRLENFDIDNSTEPFGWQGQPTNVTFLVSTPGDLSPDTYAGQVQIVSEGMLVSRLFFEVVVAPHNVEQTQMRLQQAPQRTEKVRKAFASYASADRDEVLGRIQGMQKIAPDLKVFLDVAELRSGEDWEKRLWQLIPESDVLYLFWSAAAKASPWVEKEWRCGLETRGEEFIDPVPLVSPDEVSPPEELCKKHFNDWILAYRRGRQRMWTKL